MSTMENTSREEYSTLADYIADPDTGLSWLSPTGHKEARQELLELSEDYLHDPDQAYRIADVGCGDGTLTQALAEAYPRSTIVGIDPAVPEDVEEEPYSNLTFLQQEASEALPDQQPFDIIYGINLVESTDDPERTLDILHDATRPEGYTVLTTSGGRTQDLFPDDTAHDPDSDLTYLDQEIDLDGTETTFKQYSITPEEAIELYEGAGFTIEFSGRITADTTPLPDIQELVETASPPGPDEPSLQLPLHILQRPRD